MWRMLRCGLLVAALVPGLLAPGSAEAKKGKKEPPPEHFVALFLVAKDKPKEKLFNAIANELSESPKALASLRLITSSKLKKAIGKAPETAIVSCRTDIRCIAKLGKQAKAEQVVYAKVTPQGTGVNVQILVVGVGSQIIEKKMAFDVASVSEAKSAILSRLADIFPAASALPVMAGGDSDGSEEIPLDAVLPTEAVPSAVAELVPPPPPAGFQPAASSASSSAAKNDDEVPLEAMTAPLPADSQPVTTIAAVSPEHASPPVTAARSGRSKVLTYVGIGALALGAVAAGTGGYFGLQSKSLADSIKGGPTGTPQIQAGQKLNDANSAVSRANLGYLVGGVAAVVGAVLITVDLSLGRREPGTSVTVGANPNGVTFGMSF